MSFLVPGIARRPGTKREKTILDLPWLAAGASAAIVYAALVNVLPVFGASAPALWAGSLELQAAAQWVASALLLFAVVAYLDQRRNRRRLYPYANIDSLRKLARTEFERVLAECFRLQGYTVQDASLAGTAVSLHLRKPDQNILVQCGYGSDAPVDVEAVHHLHEAMVAKKATGGLLLTSAAFTAGARACAAQKPIGLIEGRALLELVNRGRTPNPKIPKPPKALKPMVRREPHLRVSMSELRECPRCGNPMVRTRAKKGNDAEFDLWSCPPSRCTGSRPREKSRAL